MNILVVGSGGREHAIVKALKKSPKATALYAFPGNGGMAADACCLPGNPKDVDAIVAAARTCRADFVVVTPDNPLAIGAVDALHAAGFACFGPVRSAAAIESSKVYAKGLMEKYAIPTARCHIFDNAADALEYIASAPIPTVVKADGLALGKGAVVCMSREEAAAAVRSMMEEKVFGESGSRVVIEEYLEGPEVSVLSFTDGKTIVPMVSSMDHKRAWDNDQGPNTGGMGSIAPNPFYTPEIARRCMEEIYLPTMEALNAEGRPFRGCLYFGLMLTAEGPKVIEYNCRFGDPETQAVLSLLQSDLLEIMMAVEEGRLRECPVEFSAQHACCLVLASRGYPGKYETGFPITVDDGLQADLYFAGVAQDKTGALCTAGGRVMGVTVTAKTLREAVEGAYREKKKVHFENAVCRGDIGRRALDLEED